MSIEDFFVPISPGADRRIATGNPSPFAPGRAPQQPDLPVPPKSFARTLRELQRPPAAKAPAPAGETTSASTNRTTEESTSSQSVDEKRSIPHEAKSDRSAQERATREPSTGRPADSGKPQTPQSDVSIARSDSETGATVAKTPPPAPHVPIPAFTSRASTEVVPNALVPPPLAFLQELLFPPESVDVTETPTDIVPGELLIPPGGFLEALDPSGSIGANSLADAASTTSTPETLVWEPVIAPDAILPAEILTPDVESAIAVAAVPPADLPVVGGADDGLVTFEPTAFESGGSAVQVLDAAVTASSAEIPAAQSTENGEILLDPWTPQDAVPEIPEGAGGRESLSAAKSTANSKDGAPVVPSSTGPAAIDALPEHVSARREPEVPVSQVTTDVVVEAEQGRSDHVPDSAAPETGLEEYAEKRPPASSSAISDVAHDAGAEPSSPSPVPQAEPASVPATGAPTPSNSIAGSPQDIELPEREIRAAQSASQSAPVATSDGNPRLDGGSPTTETGSRQPASVAPGAKPNRESHQAAAQDSARQADSADANRSTLNRPNRPGTTPTPDSMLGSATVRMETAASVRIPLDGASDEFQPVSASQTPTDAPDPNGTAAAGRTSAPSTRVDASSPSPTTSGVRSDTAADQLLDRAAAAIRQSHDQGRQLRIRLNPPELGALQVDVTVRDGAVSARLEVQTASAHQALVDQLGQLRDALGQTGTHVERIEVHLVDAAREDGRSDGQHRQGGQSDREGRQPHSGRDHQERQQPTADDAADGDGESPRRQSEDEGDQLNIEI